MVFKMRIGSAALMVAGMVVGVPAEYFPDALDPALRSLLESGLERLVEAGARLEKVSLAHTSYAIPAYYLLAPAEASSTLSPGPAGPA